MQTVCNLSETELACAYMKQGYWQVQKEEVERNWLTDQRLDPNNSVPVFCSILFSVL
jgi:hypothetical protein